MKYREIVFIQGDEAQEPLDLYDKSIQEAADYLAQWDHGDSIPLADSLGNGTSDDLHNVKSGGTDYIMTINTRLGYIGLTATEDKE